MASPGYEGRQSHATFSGERYEMVVKILVLLLINVECLPVPLTDSVSNNT